MKIDEQRCFSLFLVLCRSGPAWTALCSCHLSHHGHLGSQQWCWPTIVLRVFSGSSLKSPRCLAWLSCWWCGITRTRVLLRVSITDSHHKYESLWSFPRDIVTLSCHLLGKNQCSLTQQPCNKSNLSEGWGCTLWCCWIEMLRLYSVLSTLSIGMYTHNVYIWITSEEAVSGSQSWLTTSTLFNLYFYCYLSVPLFLFCLSLLFIISCSPLEMFHSKLLLMVIYFTMH